MSSTEQQCYTKVESEREMGGHKATHGAHTTVEHYEFETGYALVRTHFYLGRSLLAIVFESVTVSIGQLEILLTLRICILPIFVQLFILVHSLGTSELQYRKDVDVGGAREIVVQNCLHGLVISAKMELSREMRESAYSVEESVQFAK